MGISVNCRIKGSLQLEDVNKKNKIINILGKLLLLATIVTFNIIIGANEKGLRVLPISILMTLTVIYLIALKLKNKEESIVFKSKVDYFVLAFMLTTTLPLIFRTYASYSDTVEFIMKYFFIYSVYLLARNIIKGKKQIECVIVTTLISSLIPIFLHIDFLNNQILIGFMKWLNITYSKEKAFSSTFGYANAQAICSCFCVFLAIHRFEVNKNKTLKVIDVIYILFALYIIYLAEARAIILLLGLALFILFIVKFKKQIVKHKKKVIIGIGILLFIIEAYLIIALKISKPIIKENEDINENIYYRFKQNITYTLEADFETECFNKTRIDDPLKIYILQFGKYFQESIIEEASINPQSQKLKIEFTPTVDAKCVKLKIINDYYGIIKIDNIYINGEKHIINYKYIPNNIGNLLTKFLTSGKSLPQRIYMWQDCLKIAKDSPIIGSGGNTWKIVSRTVEEYKSAWKESHSYFFELLISYGIVGVIAFLSLLIYFFIKIFKQCIKDEEKRNKKLSIALGLFIVLFHSITFDFNMSFMVIQLIVYIYMAVLIYDEQESVKKHKYINIFVLIFLAFIISLYIRADISKYLLKNNTAKYSITPYKNDYYSGKINDDIDNNLDGKELLKELKNFMKKEPYYGQTETYEKYFNTICQNIDNLSDDELNIYLDFGIERLNTIRFKTPMFFDTVLYRVNVIVNTINSLKEYINENEEKSQEKTTNVNDAINGLKGVLYKEYEINIQNIENVENGDYSEENRNRMKQTYQEIMNTVK